MTVFNAGASPSCSASSWDTIDWHLIEKQVYRLQMRIAKAVREGRHNKVKSLQRLLTHSYAAKRLAVKRVTQSQGAKTAGIDGIIWKNASQKMQAVQSLRRHGYQAQPLRRIYIPKKNGKQRPLGIPTLKDRAMQALYLLGLEPVSETTADKNSYGFRMKRSTADAIEQCFNALANKYCAQWILEGDISACFDRIDHNWLMNHVIMDTQVLAQWLKSGYMEQNILHSTEEGTPQGGVASPTLANLALDGIEQMLKKVAPRDRQKVNFIRYADDFIITGESKELLENIIKPALITFLSKRGLSLSPEKTIITHVDEGFDFLGFNIRKYQGKLLIKPAKANIKSFLQGIRQIIKTHPTIRTVELIQMLNPKIRGWANYYRHVVAKKIFGHVDNCIYEALSRWIKRRHPQKSWGWRSNLYFRSSGLRQWIFNAKSHDKNGKDKQVDLIKAASIPIRRHVKIKSDANPYDPNYHAYFDKREKQNKARQWETRKLLANADNWVMNCL